MADVAGLRLIGLAFGCITAVVLALAAVTASAGTL
jgi:hypothetical protein